MSLISGWKKYTAYYVNRKKTVIDGEVRSSTFSQPEIQIVEPQPSSENEMLFDTEGNKINNTQVTWTESEPQYEEELDSLSSLERSSLLFREKLYNILKIGDRTREGGFYKLTIVEVP